MELSRKETGVTLEKWKNLERSNNLKKCEGYYVCMESYLKELYI